MGYPSLLHPPVPVKAHVSVMADKTLGNDELAVILILIVHVHISAYAAHTSFAGILPEAYVIIVVAAVGVLCHPFIPTNGI